MKHIKKFNEKLELLTEATHERFQYENHIKMAQKIITPEIKKCYCGENAKIQTWEDYDIIYQVVCENRHTLSKYCRTRHRAICLWNNRVSQHSI